MNIKPPEKSHVPALKALFAEAFSESSDFIDAFFKLGFSKDRALVGFEDEKLCSMLYWFDVECRGERLAYIYALATAKTSRGHGYAHALLNEAHRRLASLGYSHAILLPASPTLRDYYRSLGYIDGAGINEDQVSADESPVAIRRLTLTEYLTDRRRRLPSDAVIEEGAIAELLAFDAEFYTGEDFLLAARRDGDIFFAIELLGDSSLAPAILASLGYAKGRFRSIGDGRPFAMYCQLSPSANPPAHFGIALDV